MTTWDAWFPDVTVHATTAPDPLVRQAICRASREFFRRTRAWMQWLDPIATTAGEGEEYAFVLPAESQIVRVERATTNGRPLPIESFRQIPVDWLRHPEGQRAIVTQDLQQYALVGLFAASESVQVQVSLMPQPGATGIPDDLADRHLEAIAEGAKSILFLTPNTEFFRPDLAGAARLLFEQGIGAASIDAYRGHTNQVPRASVKWC
jgi:hypothetical protein